MPNITRTLTDTSGFIPITWAQEVLRVLRANIRLAKLVARDYDFEPAFKGKTLNIPYPGTFTAQDKVENTAINPAAPSGGATVALTLNKFKTVDFIIEDWAQAQANTQLMEKYTQPAAIALAEALEGDLFSLYPSFTGSLGTSGTDVVASLLRSARKALNDNKNPMTDRSIVLSTKDEIAILGDASLQSFFAFQANQGRGEIAEGMIGRLYGFDIYMSQLVPVVTGAPNSTKNLAFHKNAILLATRPLADPPAGAGVHCETIVDEASGLSIRMMYQYDMNNRGVRVVFDLLYGFVKLRDVAGLVLLS